MTSVIAFDVNETLLDLRGLDDVFTEVFGDAELRGPWFAQMLQLSFVGGITGSYLDFTAAQHGALRMVAQKAGATLSDDQAERVVGQMQHLPAHPEVSAALARLAESSLRVVALTNSVLQVAEAQLTNAGIRPLFEGAYSADTVRALKPAAAPYQHVAEQTGVDIGEVRLVAAHAWDVSGALAAGCRAAFVARPGMVPSVIGPEPDIIGDDVAAVVARILEVDA